MLPLGGTDPSWVVYSKGKLTNPHFENIVRKHYQTKRNEWVSINESIYTIYNGFNFGFIKLYD
jgi:hypothetical protein